MEASKVFENVSPKSGFHQCPACGRVYKWKMTLTRHLRLECGQEPQFLCNHCLMRFKRKSHLERHLRLRHQAPYPKMFNCNSFKKTVP